MNHLLVNIILITVLGSIGSALIWVFIRSEVSNKKVLDRIMGAFCAASLTSFLWLPWVTVVVTTVYRANSNAANRIFPGDEVLPITPRQIVQPHPQDIQEKPATPSPDYIEFIELPSPPK